MIFNEILHELKRIANGVEKLANISDFPVEMKDKKSTVPTISYSDIEAAQEAEFEEESKEANKKLEEAKNAGFFFPEDALSEEELERL